MPAADLHFNERLATGWFGDFILTSSHDETIVSTAIAGKAIAHGLIAEI